MQACSLAATDLACRRGERVLFRGVTFTLAPGQALQITGPNGCGKSSLLRLLAGLLPVYSGTVARAGALGLVDELPALDPQLPLGRALAFWAELDGLGFVARESAADRLGLHDLLDVPVRYLSTGQKKRAALTRLLGQQAPVWLLDEPLNGLDPNGLALVEQLAAAHCSNGGICVIASHQPFELAGMAQLQLSHFLPAPSGRG